MEAFLDSSILWAYVGPRQYEPKHQPCVAVMDSSHVERFTSETVRVEVRQSERRRARMYSELIAHVRGGARPADFRTDGFSRHVESRARALLRGLRGNQADIEYLRRLMQSEAARLRDAWSKIRTPLVPYHHDPVFQDLLRLRVGAAIGDAKVVTDYLFWAVGRTQAKFLTTDDALLRAARASLAAFLGEQNMSEPQADDFLEPERFLEQLSA